MRFLKSTGRRDLNIEYTNFDQWKRWVGNKLKDITLHTQKWDQNHVVHLKKLFGELGGF